MMRSSNRPCLLHTDTLSCSPACGSAPPALLGAPALAQAQPPQAPDVSDSDIARARKEGIPKLCAHTEPGTPTHEACTRACATGWTAEPECLLYLRFGPRAQELLEALPEGAGAEDLEARAIEDGWALKRARALRWYAAELHGLEDPETAPQTGLPDPKQAHSVEALLEMNDRFGELSVIAQQEHYQARLPIYQGVLAGLEPLGPGHPHTMRVSWRAGRFMWAAGDARGAAPMLARAARAAQKTLPEGHPMRAQMWAWHLGLRCVQGWPCALEDLEEAAAQVEATYGPLHPRTIRTMRLFGRALGAQGMRARAREVLLWAVRRTRRVQGPMAPESAEAYVDLAEAACDGGDYILSNLLLGHAELLLKKYYGDSAPALVRVHLVAARRERLFAIWLSRSPDVEQIARAREHVRRAWQIRSATLGQDHPALAPILVEMARVVRAQGDGEAAVRLSVRALKMTRDALGAKHPATIAALEQLGELFVAGRQGAEARESLAAARSVRDARGETSEALIDNLVQSAEAAWQADDAEQASALAERALELRRQQLWRRADLELSGTQVTYGMLDGWKLLHDTLHYLGPERTRRVFEHVLAWQGVGMAIGRAGRLRRARVDEFDPKLQASWQAWAAHQHGEDLLEPGELADVTRALRAADALPPEGAPPGPEARGAV